METNLILPGVAPPAKPHGPDTILGLLGFALKNHVERLSIFSVEGLMMEAGRANDKRPAYLKFATLDSIVKNLVGNPKLKDEYLFVRIPREIVDRFESPIVAPGEG